MDFMTNFEKKNNFQEIFMLAEQTHFWIHTTTKDMEMRNPMPDEVYLQKRDTFSASNRFSNVVDLHCLLFFYFTAKYFYQLAPQ